MPLRVGWGVGREGLGVGEGRGVGETQVAGVKPDAQFALEDTSKFVQHPRLGTM